MSADRQQFLDLLHSLEDIGVEDHIIEALGYAFAVYEKELKDTIGFLIEALGLVTVADTIEVAHEAAANALTEVIREQ